MWVTDSRRSDATLETLTRLAVDGGVDLIHVREPEIDSQTLEDLVSRIQIVATPNARVVVNREIEVARTLGVGIHLPESGPSAEDARALLGPEALIGRSVHSPASAASTFGASYLVAGHVFETSSKAGKPPIGIAGLQAIVTATRLPVVAIGGITPDRVKNVMEAGAAGVAVLGPFTRQTEIRTKATAYRAALENAMSDKEPQKVTVQINGKTVELTSGTTIAAFLIGRELHERLVVVERNGEIIKRDKFPEVIIEEGDLLEIVHFVGGG